MGIIALYLLLFILSLFSTNNFDDDEHNNDPWVILTEYGVVN